MRFYIVDCFAGEKYQGNPLLVVLADRPLSDGEQQAITREIGFSETAFLQPEKRGDGAYGLRIWTPNAGEVPFAGHPVLGAAHIVHQELEKGRSKEVRLALKAGTVPVRVTPEGLTMYQAPPELGEVIPGEEVAEVFCLDPADLSEALPVQWASTGFPAVLIPLKSRQALARLTICRERFEAYMARRPACRCSHLFFVDMGGGSFAARCLMEDFGEDAATGSANGALAGYLMEHDYFGKREAAYCVIQGEDMGRPSLLRVEVSHLEEKWTIAVGGCCHIVAQGNWI